MRMALFCDVLVWEDLQWSPRRLKRTVYGSRKSRHTLVHAGTMTILNTIRTSYNNSRVSDYWMWLQ